MSRPVLYDHFSSKKALYLWLLEQQQSELIAHVGCLVRTQGPPEQPASVQALAAWWYDHPDTPRERLVETAMDVLWGGLARLVQAGSEGRRSGRGGRDAVEPLGVQ